MANETLKRVTYWLYGLWSLIDSMLTDWLCLYLLSYHYPFPQEWELMQSFSEEIKQENHFKIGEVKEKKKIYIYIEKSIIVAVLV